MIVKQNELISYFVAGATAGYAAFLASINRNTAILYYNKLRGVIASHLAQKIPVMMTDKMEFDESYLGGVRKYKRESGTGGRILVFGLVKRNSKVYAFPTSNA